MNSGVLRAYRFVLLPLYPCVLLQTSHSPVSPFFLRMSLVAGLVLGSGGVLGFRLSMYDLDYSVVDFSVLVKPHICWFIYL